MKQHQFVKLRTEQWKLFETLIKDAELAKEHDFPHLYRQLSHDLAIAKSRHYSPAIVEHINQLLVSGQQHLYKPANRLIAPLVDFFRYTFPASLKELRQYIVTAHLLFYGTLILSAFVMLIVPDAITHVMPSNQLMQFEQMYDPDSEHFAKERASDGDFYMFGHYIMNNISIAFQCFTGGLLLGFGTLYFLLFNAIFIGALSGHVINIGYSSTFYSFVVTHGAFELTAIVLSAAAGLIVGMSLLRPGEHSRGESLRLAAIKAYPIVIGAFLFLIIAAFVEAFWSSSRFIPNEVKYLVGALCWFWVLSYIFARGKRANR